MKLFKLAGAFASIFTFLFGATPTQAQTAPHAPRIEPGQKPKPIAKVRLHERLFKNERQRQERCDFLEAWRNSIARNDRQSAKFLRRLDLEIAATRDPKFFEKGRGL